MNPKRSKVTYSATKPKQPRLTKGLPRLAATDKPSQLASVRASWGWGLGFRV